MNTEVSKPNFEKMRLSDFVKKTCIDMFNGIKMANDELGVTTVKAVLNNKTYETRKIRDLIKIDFEVCLFDHQNEVYVRHSSENTSNTNLKFSITINPQDVELT